MHPLVRCLLVFDLVSSTGRNTDGTAAHPPCSSRCVPTAQTPGRMSTDTTRSFLEDQGLCLFPQEGQCLFKRHKSAVPDIEVLTYTHPVPEGSKTLKAQRAPAGGGTRKECQQSERAARPAGRGGKGPGSAAAAAAAVSRGARRSQRLWAPEGGALPAPGTAEKVTWPRGGGTNNNTPDGTEPPGQLRGRGG